MESVSLPKQLSDSESPSERVHRGFAFVRFTHWESIPYCEKIFANTTLFGQRLVVRASHGRNPGSRSRGSHTGDTGHSQSFPSRQFSGGNPGPSERYSLPGFQQTRMTPLQRFRPPFMTSPLGFSTPVRPPGVVSSPVVPPVAGLLSYAYPGDPNRMAMSPTVDGRREDTQSESRGSLTGPYRDGYPDRRVSRDFGGYHDNMRGISHQRFAEDGRYRDSHDSRDRYERDRYQDRGHSYESGRDRDRDYDQYSSSRRSEASVYDDRSYRQKYDDYRTRERDVGVGRSGRYRDSSYSGRYSDDY